MSAGRLYVRETLLYVRHLGRLSQIVGQGQQAVFGKRGRARLASYSFIQLKWCSADKSQK